MQHVSPLRIEFLHIEGRTTDVDDDFVLLAADLILICSGTDVLGEGAVE